MYQKSTDSGSRLSKTIGRVAMLRNTARSEKKAHSLRSAYAEKGKSAWPYVSILGAELEPIEDSLAEGKSFRETVSRKAHARWKVHERRDDMLRILHANDTGRLPELIPIRYGRMLQSTFAFYRGAVAVMAADLAKTSFVEEGFD